jgi:WD40 repeat protein
MTIDHRRWTISLPEWGESTIVYRPSSHQKRNSCFHSDFSLAVGETDGVEIWRTKDWTKITVLPAGWPTSIAFSDSGGLIAAADSSNVQVWSVTKDFEKAASLSGHRDTVNCVAFSPTNRHLVSCGDDGQIIIWRTSDGERVKVHDAGKHGLRYFSVAVSHELNEIAVRRDRADVIIMRTGDILRH